VKKAKVEGVSIISNHANFQIFTIKEAVEFFNLPIHFVRQLVLTKAIPSIKAGKKYLVNEKILEKYLKSESGYGKL